MQRARAVSPTLRRAKHTSSVTDVHMHFSHSSHVNLLHTVAEIVLTAKRETEFVPTSTLNAVIRILSTPH